MAPKPSHSHSTGRKCPTIKPATEMHKNPSGKAGKGRCGALGKGSFHEAVRSRLMRKRKEKEQGNTNSNKEKKARRRLAACQSLLLLPKEARKRKTGNQKLLYTPKVYSLGLFALVHLRMLTCMRACESVCMCARTHTHARTPLRALFATSVIR